MSRMRRLYYILLSAAAGSYWSIMLSAFSCWPRVSGYEPGIELVAGHSYIPTEPGKSKVIVCMQAVETLIYRVAGTAGLAMHLPLTSTGNNLAYRKSFFKSVHGFDSVLKIQSGDDDLLMQKLATDRPWAMRYCIAPNTFVPRVRGVFPCRLW